MLFYRSIKPKLILMIAKYTIFTQGIILLYHITNTWYWTMMLIISTLMLINLLPVVIHSIVPPDRVFQWSVLSVVTPLKGLEVNLSKRFHQKDMSGLALRRLIVVHINQNIQNAAISLIIGIFEKFFHINYLFCL